MKEKSRKLIKNPAVIVAIVLVAVCLYLFIGEKTHELGESLGSLLNNNA